MPRLLSSRYSYVLEDARRIYCFTTIHLVQCVALTFSDPKPAALVEIQVCWKHSGKRKCCWSDLSSSRPSKGSRILRCFGQQRTPAIIIKGYYGLCLQNAFM